MMADLAEIVGDIRACVISSKGPLSLKTLSGDYESLVGNQIPYRQFSYSSLEEFLRSQPSLKVCGSGSYATVEAATSNQSKHISELVSKQKPKIKKKFVPQRKYAPEPYQKRRSPGAGYSKENHFKRGNPSVRYYNYKKENPSVKENHFNWENTSKYHHYKENNFRRETTPVKYNHHKEYPLMKDHSNRGNRINSKYFRDDNNNNNLNKDTHFTWETQFRDNFSNHSPESLFRENQSRIRPRKDTHWKAHDDRPVAQEEVWAQTLRRSPPRIQPHVHENGSYMCIASGCFFQHSYNGKQVSWDPRDGSLKVTIQNF
ncbi:uncharacterized protein LOC128994910 [Macrosteles quadrilineatus]|uniref:uncharacterized protein LOC128994910 n=1 Tax=Macrosteles quadrilineatus TaxID=74068 RepID=UPI0023E0E954|nr:uncharacterized protein LOC128994910 [Macrosteles quadrilineatus]